MFPVGLCCLLVRVAVRETADPLAALVALLARVTVAVEKPAPPPQPLIIPSDTPSVATSPSTDIQTDLRLRGMGKISRQERAIPPPVIQDISELCALLADVVPRPVVWMVTTELPPAETVAGDAVMVKPPGSGVPPAMATVPVKP